MVIVLKEERFVIEIRRSGRRDRPRQAVLEEDEILTD